MTESLNEMFRRNPRNFVQTHDIAVNPQITDTSLTKAGPASVNLVMADRSITPMRVNMLKNTNVLNRLTSSRPVKAFYLPASINQPVTLRLGQDKDYMFTPDLSGCLFAAYGPNNKDVTVEHVNVRDIRGAGLIGFRIHQILSARHGFTFLMSPENISNRSDYPAAVVVNYHTGAVVVGKRNPGGNWQFIYRNDGLDAKLLC